MYSNVEKTSAVIAAVLLSVIAMSGFLILPLYMGAVANTLAMSEAQLGYTATALMGGSAISSIAAIVWIRRINWRVSAGLALLSMLVATGMSLWVKDIASFVAIQVLLGLGGGAAYSIALTVLSDHPQADRCFGFSVAAQVTFQILGLYFLPVLVEESGLPGILQLLIALQAVGLVLLLWLPEEGKAVPQPSQAKLVANPAVLLALFGCFMFFLNVGVVWTYIERMAVHSGLTAEIIGQSLAIGVAFGVPGALLASWCGERFGHLLPLTIAAVLMVVSLWMLKGDISEWNYLVGLSLYNFTWNYSLAYQYAVVNSTDSSGRSVAAAPAFHALGAATGPGIAAMFVSSESFLAVTVLSMAAVIFSLVLFMSAIGQRRPTEMAAL